MIFCNRFVLECFVFIRVFNFFISITTSLLLKTRMYQLIDFTVLTFQCTKNLIFNFPSVLKRWSFQKKLHWNMIFLKLLGKMILFPGNIILFFRRKMKDDLSQKNTWKYDIFFKCSEKMVFPKKLHWNMIFLIS